MFAWFANPALIATWVLMLFRKLRMAALWCAIAALVISLTFLLHGDMMKDEGGNRAQITAYGVGYWLWIASIVTAVIGCFACILRDRAEGDVMPAITPPPLDRHLPAS
jgi:hypothetical protein